MGTEFGEYVRDSRTADSPDAARLREVYRADIALGADLRRAREARGLTQRQLAEAAGVSEPEVARVERGAADAAEATVQIPSGVLGIGQA